MVLNFFKNFFSSTKTKSLSYSEIMQKLLEINIVKKAIYEEYCEKKGKTNNWRRVDRLKNRFTKKFHKQIDQSYRYAFAIKTLRYKDFLAEDVSKKLWACLTDQKQIWDRDESIYSPSPLLIKILDEKKIIEKELKRGIPPGIDDLDYTGEYIEGVQSLIKFAFNKQISEKEAKKIFEEMIKVNMYDLVQHIGAICIFIKKVTESCLNVKYDIVYSIDKSGRPLGLLLFYVLKELKKIGKTKFYFINRRFLYGKEYKEDPVKAVTFYSEKQKEEVKGKTTLLLDEYINYGSTVKELERGLVLAGARNVVTAILGEEKAYALEFEKKNRFSTTTASIDWRSPGFLGVIEPVDGEIVKVDKAKSATARNFRKALKQLAKIIARYI